MTLKKGKIRHHLKNPVDVLNLCRCRTATMPSYWEAMMQIGLEAMADLQNKEGDREGIPRYVALENRDAIIVHPRPAKQLECEVFGYVMVKN